MVDSSCLMFVTKLLWIKYLLKISVLWDYYYYCYFFIFLLSFFLAWLLLGVSNMPVSFPSLAKTRTRYARRRIVTRRDSRFSIRIRIYKARALLHEPTNVFSLLIFKYQKKKKKSLLRFPPVVKLYWMNVNFFRFQTICHVKNVIDRGTAWQTLQKFHTEQYEVSLQQLYECVRPETKSPYALEIRVWPTTAIQMSVLWFNLEEDVEHTEAHTSEARGQRGLCSGYLSATKLDD